MVGLIPALALRGGGREKGMEGEREREKSFFYRDC